MKKILSLVLAVMMVLSMAACTNNDNGTTTAGTTEAQGHNPGSSLEILENVWAAYAEDEKFAVIGGSIDPETGNAANMEGPGNYDMAQAENLTYNLLIPADQLANVDEAATMIHMMNANTFTGGVVHLTDGADVEAFVDALRTAIQGNQWMCGFPDKLVIGTIGNYVLVAFGLNDAMDPFQEHLGTVYSGIQIAYDEVIGG